LQVIPAGHEAAHDRTSCTATRSLHEPSTAIAQQALVVKALSEKKVTELPSGPLFWRLENLPALVQAQAVAGRTGLTVESGGKVWLFALGPAGGSSAGGTKVAEVGPLPSD
jgi:hypothetical protein